MGVDSKVKIISDITVTPLDQAISLTQLTAVLGQHKERRLRARRGRNSNQNSAP